MENVDLGGSSNLGHSDIEQLNKIYRYVTELSQENQWPFVLKEDSGDKETAIMVLDNGMTLMPPQQFLQGEIFVPDIMDWHNKIIIEYEESAKPNTGHMKAKKHKGHSDYTNTRDSNRDNYYTKIANPPFKLLKIWDWNKTWQTDAKVFLEKCYKEMQT